MAIVYCEDCGEKVSTEATACPHCGKPRKDAETSKGWVSALIRNFAVISGVLTLLGGAIAFFYQRHQEIVARSDEIKHNSEIQSDREARLKLSQMAETRQSKRPVLDLQLSTYQSVLANVAAINTMYISEENHNIAILKADTLKAVKDFITDYDGRMAFVEDRRTEVVMEMVNIAIQVPYLPSGSPEVDRRKCTMHDVTPILAHCMKLSIAASWDFPTTGPIRDDYCNLEYVFPVAIACAVPLSAEAQSEFRAIQASNYRNQKSGAVGVIQ